MAQPVIHEIIISTNNVEITCTLNGLPFYKMKSKETVTNPVTANLFLVDQENVMEVIAKRLDSDHLGWVSFRGEVGGEGSFAVPDYAIHDARTFRFSFNNTLIDFSRLLRKGASISENEVVEYGRHLRLLAEERNTSRLMEEFGPKINDYATAFNAPRDLLMKQAMESINIFLSDSKVGEKITATPFCENRIWRIDIDGHEFFYYKTEKSTSTLAVFVAMVDGKIKVVR
ncbi:MAG TPA: hypothetical protein VGD65_20890 [Chryseosolibacter sp.]